MDTSYNPIAAARAAVQTYCKAHGLHFMSYEEIADLYGEEEAEGLECEGVDSEGVAYVLMLTSGEVNVVDKWADGRRYTEDQWKLVDVKDVAAGKTLHPV